MAAGARGGVARGASLCRTDTKTFCIIVSLGYLVRHPYQCILFNVFGVGLGSLFVSHSLY